MGTMSSGRSLFLRCSPLFSTTNTAVASSSIKESIKHIIRMSLWTVRLTSIASLECITPKKIDSSRYWFQVVGVYTRGITTEVVNLQSFRDYPNQQLVRKAMSRCLSFNTPFVETELPISSISYVRLPYPTRRPIPKRPSLINLLPETLINRTQGAWFRFGSIIDSCGHSKTPWFNLEAHSDSYGPPSITRGLSVIISQRGYAWG